MAGSRDANLMRMEIAEQVRNDILNSSASVLHIML